MHTGNAGLIMESQRRAFLKTREARNIGDGGGLATRQCSTHNLLRPSVNGKAPDTRVLDKSFGRWGRSCKKSQDRIRQLQEEGRNEIGGSGIWSQLSLATTVTDGP